MKIVRLISVKARKSFCHQTHIYYQTLGKKRSVALLYIDEMQNINLNINLLISKRRPINDDLRQRKFCLFTLVDKENLNFDTASTDEKVVHVINPKMSIF